MRGQARGDNNVEVREGNSTIFTRWVGQAALLQLQTYALEFAKTHLA